MAGISGADGGAKGRFEPPWRTVMYGARKMGIPLETTMSATVTARGQITVPKRVRDFLRLAPGSRVDFVLGEDGAIRLVNANGRPTRSARKFLGYAKGEMSTEQIMALLRGDD
jgi:AbrB family looped-hinge helix DNA binding protein